ncbi:glycosyl hydrolase family 8 [Agarivorans sp. TSD2052]|uniref:glycosyl hydrolase family 8 n=1 Tax=Agarivorans sp. TSD2052 TaxID=2937286 RepID=UPI00200EA75D|nr:glycosyl hydrolase family 8 [Agarivorans sp. TSD2052]UPW19697.1 glycosyl hydrolase family 8 [Agarivorans sp. TSD2052]
MIFNKPTLALIGLTVLSPLCSAEVLQKFELENGSLLPGYSGLIDSPFNGVAAYADNDGVEAQVQLSNIPGQFRLDIRGASSANNTAGISVYLAGKKLGATEFSGTSASVNSISFKLDAQPSSSTLQFKLETDNGSNDTLLDWFELHRVGDVAPPPPPPVLPSAGAYETGVYRNMFAELGYSQAEVDAKVQAVYDQLFHSSDTANKALFIPVGNDMAYIWDVGNNDVRSEGMSYGMMMAVQMGRQEDFNKLWKWAHTYSLNKSGNNKGYFAWKVSTSGNIQDANPAPDGEEYFVTALFFASHLWGDGSGIYNYREQANQILKDMYGNGETRYNNQGQLEEFSLFNHAENQIVFSPATPTDRNWTDPSYHLPAFYELWARWADNNNDFWAGLAVTSREFLKTTVNPANGLSPDYAYFDGTPHGDFQHWKDTFQYDAWRTVGNAAMDFAWWQNDPWQTDYVNALQGFFQSEGIDSYSSLYELDGTPYQNNSDHSPGLVAMNALASLASDNERSWEFVQAFWDTPVPSGKYRYYDGTLYMFGMLALSGNYRIICPAGECDVVTPPPTGGNKPPVANNDSASTQQDTAVNIQVLQNDSDADGDSLTITSFTQAGNGSVSQVGNALSYTPNSGFVGSDSFSYTLSDGQATANASVAITVSANDGGGTPPVEGELLEQVQLENGVISPSYRQPITSPYAGVILYGNSEAVTVNTSNLNAGSYRLVINGSSSNNTAAGISVYAGSQKIGTSSFSGTSRTEQTINFSLSSSVSSLKFVLESDVGQNDTLLDWYKLYSGSSNPVAPSEVLLQAEDYTQFYDTSSGNAGGSYRSDDVDLQITSDLGGGYNLGWTAAGEWLEYSVDLAAGTYQIEVRVASNPGGGQYNIELAGQQVVAATNVGATGGWQNWQSQMHNNVVVDGGQQTLRFNIQQGNFNLNWIKFIPVN